MRRTFIPVILLGLLAWASAAGAHDLKPASTAERQADYAVQLFMTLCVPTGGNLAAVEHFAIQQGLRRLQPEAARYFLGKYRGGAWGQRTSLGLFALALTSQGICSVFAHRADARFLKADLESWLPPRGSGFRVAPGPSLHRNGLATYSYTLSSHRVKMMWVLSTTKRMDGAYQGVISLVVQ